MEKFKTFELPADLKQSFEKAKKLEWITIVYLITVIIMMYLVMGSSQAMKTAWLEDALSIIPAISFLVASRYFNNKPNPDFPYGYHTVYSIAFLCGALALFLMGGFLCIDSSISLFTAEHPTIGTIQLFGRQIWMGWVMIAALIYSSLPAVLLGRLKMPLAKKLHNKILYTDAEAQKADYMTAFGAIGGIVGVGLGWWWADALVALLISGSVLKDGFTNLSTAIKDLLDRHPVHVKNGKKDELVEEIEAFVQSWDWVKATKVRFREKGQVYFGEIWVILSEDDHIPERLEEGLKSLGRFHWKVHDIIIMPVNQLPQFD